MSLFFKAGFVKFISFTFTSVRGQAHSPCFFRLAVWVSPGRIHYAIGHKILETDIVK